MELDAVRDELEVKNHAIAKLKSELELGEVKQLNLFPGQEPTQPPTPEPTPIPTPESKPKAKSKPKTKQENDPNSLIIPPGYKLGDSAELIEFVLEKFPNSELKNKGQLTDAIRDKDTKAKGSEFSRLFGFEQKYEFKHLGKIGAKHQFLIPIV